MSPINELLFDLNPIVADITDKLRLIIKSSLPNVVEEVKYNVPQFYYDNKPLCYINTFEDKVLLVFNDAESLKTEKNNQLEYFSVDEINRPQIITYLSIVTN